MLNDWLLKRLISLNLNIKTTKLKMIRVLFLLLCYLVIWLIF